jgi:anti-sigma B factor antagonist
MSLRVTSRVVNDVTILDMAGRIDLGEGSVVFRDTIRGLLGKDIRKIVANMSEVSYIDSSGIGEVFSGVVLAMNRGGSLRLSNLTKRVKDLLQITKLYTAIDVYDTEDSAVASFQGGVRVLHCPVCNARIGSLLDHEPPGSERICPACQSQVGLRPTDKASEMEVTKLRVRSYEGEYVEIRPGSPYVIRVVGKLDRFGYSSAVSKAWSVIPSPRCALFDLTHATDATAGAVNELLQLAQSGGVAISLEGVAPALVSLLGMNPPVYPDTQSARAALRDIAVTPRWIIGT